MTHHDLYKQAKELLLTMAPCVDGGYDSACPSCVAEAIATWVEGLRQEVDA